MLAPTSILLIPYTAVEARFESYLNILSILYPCLFRSAFVFALVELGKLSLPLPVLQVETSGSMSVTVTVQLFLGTNFKLVRLMHQGTSLAPQLRHQSCCWREPSCRYFPAIS